MGVKKMGKREGGKEPIGGQEEGLGKQDLGRQPWGGGDSSGPWWNEYQKNQKRQPINKERKTLGLDHRGNNVPPLENTKIITQRGGGGKSGERTEDNMQILLRIANTARK